MSAPITIRMTKRTRRELADFLQSAVCGHASPPLTRPARRAYKKLLDADFNVSVKQIKERRK